MHIKKYEIYYKATSQTRNIRIKTSLFVYKKVFLPPHVLCIKCTFPASASRAAIGFIRTQPKKQTKRKREKKQQKGV